MFTQEEKGWVFYGIKIGLVAAVFLGVGIAMYFSDPLDRLQQLFGIISMGCGVLLIIGAYAVKQGIRPGKFRNVKIKIEED